MNNGYTTNRFKPSKDMRQDCPLALFLFILSAELMFIKLRYVPEVKGINLFGNELKLPKFVDDTNLFCADLISVEKALRSAYTRGLFGGTCRRDLPRGPVP